MKKRSVVAAITGIAMFATAAFAAVTFDVDTGKGFVGKGDVQIAFGWNNKALQANASGVAFSYNSTDTYAAVCTFVTGEGTKGEKIHNVTREKTAGVSGILDGDPRQTKGQNQFTGFILDGYIGDPVVTGGDAPVVGGACPGGGPEGGEYTSVELLSSTGGLLATHNGITVALQ